MTEKTEKPPPRWFAVLAGTFAIAICVSFLTPHPLYAIPAIGRAPFVLLVAGTAICTIVAAFRPDLIPSDNKSRLKNRPFLVAMIAYGVLLSWLSFALMAANPHDPRNGVGWLGAILGVAMSLIALGLLFLKSGHRRE